VPGFLEVPGVTPGSGLDRGHLRASMLGGSGERPENLTAIYHFVNNGPMKRIESLVRSKVQAGEIVQYRVTPIYRGNRKIPAFIKIEAKGDRGFQLSQTLRNRP